MRFVAAQLEGQAFGRWTVIEAMETRTSYGTRRWLCRCACGRMAIIPTGNLTRGLSTQCQSCATRLRPHARTPDSERRCRWCARSTVGTRFVRECGACQRQACRHGRDAEGRPIAKRPRPVLGAAS